MNYIMHKNTKYYVFFFIGNQNCTSEEFPCYHGEQCVPRLHICDHYHDCHDGSDEDVCGMFIGYVLH